ncbi:MAG: tRNA pseudouridine(55) synthase TruB, partial [Clostridia bacterium]|nr:tRNA pseudouridine(55) synthase TruB [Clostridia bacterium]
MATGVLPLMLGRATRAIPLLPTHDKCYRATLRFGFTSDTLDVWGAVTPTGKALPTATAVAAALPQFRGEILQVPPMVSALKKDGVRLYELARQGIEVEREARPITVYRLEAETYHETTGELTLLCECSAGTYIRTLCDDLGAVLGCGAVMTALRRTQAAGYDEAVCYTIEEWEQFAREGTLEAHIHPVDTAFSVYPSVSVSQAQATRFSNGGALALDRLGNQTVDGITRVYAPDHTFLGLGTPAEGELQVLRLLG